MAAMVFLAAPLCMCFALFGIHCYLGIHVLARGVIFVDLALAQVAAFGTVVAFALGYEHEHWKAYLISLGATWVVAFFLAFSSRLKKQVSQEALIGIIYALASASIILFLDHMSHGAEHLKQSLVGQLLWVTWGDVIQVLCVYSLVGLVHFVFRRKLMAASFSDLDMHWVWNFLFYALFGVVITCSVQVAGVLLVFSFLIVPAIVSSMFFDKIAHRLICGWMLGVILSGIGMVLSYKWDLPSGAVIVVLFTLIPILLTLMVRKTAKRGLAVRR